jgi:hypothetical protein
MLSKTEPLNVKILPEHKRALQALAKLESEPVSVVLRRMIKRTAQENGVWSNVNPEPVTSSQEPKAASQGRL